MDRIYEMNLKPVSEAIRCARMHGDNTLIAELCVDAGYATCGKVPDEWLEMSWQRRLRQIKKAE